MKTTGSSLIIVFFVTFIFLANIPAWSQTHWIELNTPAAFTGKEITPYFLNENLGFCYVAGLAGKQNLFRTTDGGSSWDDVSFFQTDNINQIYFVGAGHGYLVGLQTIYETRDTGLSWKIILQTKVNLHFYSVYSSAGKVFVGAVKNYPYNIFYNKLLVTSNDGIKWDTVLSGPRVKNSLSLGSYVFGNKEGMVYTENPDTSGAFSFLWTSSDTGKTWVSTPMNFSTEGIFSFPHCDDLLRTSFNGGDVYQIEHFINSEWSNSFPDAEIGAWVTGDACALYVCNAAPLLPDGDLDSDGLLRSTDRGLTWQYILGPETIELDDVDFHNISVVGGGAVVYLGDTYGNLWKTIDGGDGRLSASSLVSKIGFQYLPTPGSKDTIQSKVCDSSLIQIFLQNLSCNVAQLQSMTINGLDSDQYIPSLKHHLSCENEPDSLSIRIKPLASGTYKLLTHLRFINDEFTIIDTSFIIILNVAKSPETKISFTSSHLGSSDTLNFGRQVLCFSGGKDTMLLSNPSCVSIQVKKISLETDSGSTNDFSISASTPLTIQNDTPPGKIITIFHPLTSGIKNGRIIVATNLGIDTIFLFAAIDSTGTFHLNQPQINFDSVSTCISITKSAYIVNNNCDSVLVSEYLPAKQGRFIRISPTLPAWLHVGDSLQVTITYSPKSIGLDLDSVIFLGTNSNAQHTYLTLLLSGHGEAGGGVLAYSPKQFNFQSLSICGHDSASGFVTNIGCDSLLLDPAMIFGSPDFTFSALSSQYSVLMPGDTMKYEVYLNPARKGLRQGYLILSSNNKIILSHDTVYFTVTVTGGTVILTSSLTTADFGLLSVCDERDTLVTLFNSGCDTLLITGYGVSGSGFGTDTKFPIIILPGKDTVVHIFTLLDTTGGKNFTTGALTFLSNSDSALPPISLSRTFIQATHRDLGFYLDPAPKTGGDLSVVSYEIKESPGKSFIGAGIRDITFDLNYNTDLLTFTLSKSSNITSSDGKSFAIANANEIEADANGILATIGFTVYLTKDSTTTIDLRNVKIDTASLPCTTTTFSYSGSTTFDYHYLCGERSISGFMNGSMPMRIVSLHPNPSQDEIELDLESAATQDATMEIFDALGAKVFSDTRNIIAGANFVHLDTKNLSGGMYLVRIGDTSQSFLKIK